MPLLKWDEVAAMVSETKAKSAHNPLANVDDNSCFFAISGCMSDQAFNYNSEATVDDGRHEEQSHNDKARDDAADRVNRAPYRALRGRWRRRLGVSRALSWRGQSVQINVRERRAHQ